MSGLGHAIVEHFLRDVDCGFATYEHDAAPAFRHHTRQVMAARAHATHYVQLEEVKPVLIGDICDILDAVVAPDVCCTDVVHKDIGVRRMRDQGLCPLRCRKISGDTRDVAAGEGLPHLPHRLIDPSVSTAVDDDRCTGTRQPLRRRAADTGGGSGNNGLAAFEFDIHLIHLQN